MTEQNIGLIVITPMIVATALALWRQGAMSLKGVAAVAVASLGVASYLFFNQ